MKHSARILFGTTVVLAAVFATGGSTAAQPHATRVLPRRHGPAKIHRRRPDNTVETENWSGYAVTGSSFTDAKGSWVVPTVNCSVTPGSRTSPTYSSFWVGLDGYSSNTVEQIGTDSDCDRSTPTYYAWYEFYPADSFEINLAVSPGDKMSAEVSYSGKEFTVTLTDLTTGATFSKTGTVQKAKRTSAEWIAEAPCCTRGGGILPLSDFGTVGFGQNNSSVSNTNYAETSSIPLGPISVFGTAVDQIDMESSSGVPEANTASLSADGTSFSVAWASE